VEQSNKEKETIDFKHSSVQWFSLLVDQWSNFGWMAYSTIDQV